MVPILGETQTILWNSMLRLAYQNEAELPASTADNPADARGKNLFWKRKGVSRLGLLQPIPFRSLFCYLASFA